MSRDERTAGRLADRWVTRSLLALAAGLLLVAPGTAGAGNEGSGSRVSSMSNEDQMIADAMRLDRTWVELFNARKWDELGAAYYAPDAIGVPPNHEPIRGRDAIVAYFRDSRDAFGEAQVEDTDTWRASASGKIVSLVAKYSAYSGHLRVTAHELFERQPDGSLKCTVDMFGFSDPAM